MDRMVSAKARMNTNDAAPMLHVEIHSVFSIAEAVIFVESELYCFGRTFREGIENIKQPCVFIVSVQRQITRLHFFKN